jgi:hypothetical protein
MVELGVTVVLFLPVAVRSVEGDGDVKLEEQVALTVEKRVPATPKETGTDWSAVTEKSQ